MLDQIKAVQNKQVFDNQGKGPNAWFEQRLAEYDVVALDFCEIVGTSNPEAQHERQWFRNVYTESVGTSAECNGVDEPLVVEGAQCSLLGSYAVPTCVWSGVAAAFMLFIAF